MYCYIHWWVAHIIFAVLDTIENAFIPQDEVRIKHIQRLYEWNLKHCRPGVVFVLNLLPSFAIHYGDVIMGTMACQSTGLLIVYSTVYSGAYQRKHQSSASLAFVGPVNSPHKWPLTRKMFPFHDVIMQYTIGTLLGLLFNGISIYFSIYAIYFLYASTNQNAHTRLSNILTPQTFHRMRTVAQSLTHNKYHSLPVPESEIGSQYICTLKACIYFGLVSDDDSLLLSSFTI